MECDQCVLTIEFEPPDTDLVLDHINASGDVVLATNSGDGLVHKPLIMIQSETIATGIYYQWKAAKAAPA